MPGAGGGGGRMGTWSLMGTEFQFRKVKCSGDGWWWELHNVTVSATIQSMDFSRTLEWVAFPFSSRSSRTRNRTRVSCIAGGFFTNWAIREAHKILQFLLILDFRIYNHKASLSKEEKRKQCSNLLLACLFWSLTSRTSWRGCVIV